MWNFMLIPTPTRVDSGPRRLWSFRSWAVLEMEYSSNLCKNNPWGWNKETYIKMTAQYNCSHIFLIYNACLCLAEHTFVCVTVKLGVLSQFRTSSWCRYSLLSCMSLFISLLGFVGLNLAFHGSGKNTLIFSKDIFILISINVGMKISG